jgi:tetratricopeptide (TPR) repeat protein
MRRLEREHDNLWAALAYARDAPDPLLAAHLGVGLGWYFGTAERVSEGREFTEAALAHADGAPLPLRVELLSYLCYFATEEGDLDTAIAVGQRGLALAADDAPWQTAMVTLALAFACSRSGHPERAADLSEDARRRFDEVGDGWGAGLSAFNGALAALGLGEMAAAAALTADAVRLNDGYDVGAVPAALLEGWLAERSGDAEAAAAAYRRALDASERAGFADHASFARVGLGSLAFASGDFAEAEAEFRGALAVADAASAAWLVAYAKTRLAQVLEAAGDTEASAVLYREVLAWPGERRRHSAREALFIALAGNPAEAALAALGS